MDWTWVCPRGHQLKRWDVVGDHPRPWSVPEHVVLGWAGQAALEALGSAFRFDGESEVTPDAIAARHEDLRRLGVTFRAGALDEPEFESEAGAIREDIARLEGAERSAIAFSLGIDWSQPTAAVNARLHELLHAIPLGPDMRPTGGVWRRQPMTDDGPFPDIEPVEGGWFLASPPAPTSMRGTPAHTRDA